MRLEGNFAVHKDRERVFSFFLNPPELLRCIDDPHTVEIIDRDNFKGQIKTGVGFIKGNFAWSARVAEKDPPERSRIRVHGSGMGSAFDVDSTIQLSESGGLTTVRWQADVVMNGTIASVGARLLRGTIDKKMSEFFQNAQKKLEGS